MPCFEFRPFFIGNLVSAGASIWALCVVPEPAPFAHLSYMISFVHCFCELLELKDQDLADMQTTVVEYTRPITQMITLPLIVLDFCRICKPGSAIATAIINFGIVSLPFIAKRFIEDEVTVELLTDIALVANVASLAFIVQHNPKLVWPQALLTLTMMHNLFLRPMFKDLSVAQNERYLFGMAFEILLSVRCFDELRTSMGDEEEASNADCPKFLEDKLELTEFWAGHWIAATTTIWALQQIPLTADLTRKSYMLVLGNSLLGMAFFGYEGADDWQGTLFRYTSLLTQTATLPMITNDLYFACGMSSRGFGRFHLLLAVLPTLGEMALDEENNYLVDLSIMGNVASLAYLINNSNDYLWPQMLLTLSIVHNYFMRPFLQYKGVSRIERITLNSIFQTILSLYCFREILL